MGKVSVIEKAPSLEEKGTDRSGRGYGAKTILFNDDVHTFEEVAGQLVKAIRCPFSRGMKIAFEVHSSGSAVVYSGHLERCEAVAMVLEQIAA